MADPGFLTHVVCLECQHETKLDTTAGSFPAVCPACKSGWLDARYDYEAVARLWPEVIAQRAHSLWRYSELLPLSEADPEISMGEGYTPLIRLYQYEKHYSHPHIYMKDERHEPTNSFKDRQAALSVTAMRRAGIRECVLASTGNAAVAYAAYCARAGIKLWLFLTSLVPAEKMREAALYGAEVVKVSGTYDETKHVAAEFAAHKGIFMDKGAKTIPSKESMKTLAYEIAEQLGLEAGGTGWRSPDWYIQSVSGGIGPLGVWKGFNELFAMGLIDHMPKLGIVQAAGCAPMVNAMQAGAEHATPVIPKTLIHVLATGDPGYAYTLLRAAILRDGGAMIAVEDGETFRSMRQLASRAGISVEPATAVAFAGLEKMIREGIIAQGESVVVNCSGHTFPAESHVLGDQYDRYILSLEVKDETQGEEVPGHEHSLGAALQNLDEQVTTIVVVDDNANDRRLIRRLLQSYKNYRVYEAHDGAEALRVIADRQPDLVVADLTMPEMDGFTLLEHLKRDSATAHIPVVVVSAKSLSAADRKVLETYSDSVWTKGGFETRELVEHVVTMLGHTAIEVIRPGDVGREEAATVTHTIVAIDDNIRDLRLIKRQIQSLEGFRMIEATSGRDGLKAIYSHHPDLILLDLMLPDVDGFSILETLQNDPKLRDIPVIVVSAREVTAEERLHYRNNIREIIEKAVLDGKDLAHIIKSTLSDN